MGILLVLIFYLVLLSGLAVVCSGFLRAGVSRYLRPTRVPRRKPLTIATLFPFACVIYAGVWFVAYAGINGVVFNHDPMIGDGWYTDLGNGYSIEMIDVTDQGYLRPSGGGDINSPSSVQGVRRLQIVGSEIFGARDSESFKHSGTESKAEDVFFALDTKSYSVKSFQSQAALDAHMAQQGFQLKLLPIERVYEQYRFGWFDWCSFAVLLAVPIAGLSLFVRWLMQLGSTQFEREKEIPA